MRYPVSVFLVLSVVVAVDLVSAFLDLVIRILILIVILNRGRSNPHMGDMYDRVVDSFAEDVVGLSWAVLLVRWGQDGILRVSAVRFVMSCWSM